MYDIFKVMLVSVLVLLSLFVKFIFLFIFRSGWIDGLIIELLRLGVGFWGVNSFFWRVEEIEF